MYKKPQYRKGTSFFPNFVMEDVLVIFIFLAIFFWLICFFPEWIIFGDADMPANPLETPAHIKPEWYFLAAYQLLKIIPSKMGALVFQTLCVLILVFLPFIDRQERRTIFRRPVFLACVLTSIIAFVGLTLWGYFS